MAQVLVEASAVGMGQTWGTQRLTKCVILNINPSIFEGL